MNNDDYDDYDNNYDDDRGTNTGAPGEANVPDISAIQEPTISVTTRTISFHKLKICTLYSNLHAGHTAQRFSKHKIQVTILQTPRHLPMML